MADTEPVGSIDPEGDARAEAEETRRSLARFIRTMWHVLEPGTDLVWGRHLDLICEGLQSVTDGRTKRLVINVPPGTMKSLTTSVFWPAWEWLTNPGQRWLFTSNGEDLVKRDSRRMRQLINSPEYQELVRLTTPQGRKPWTLAGDQNEKIWYETDATGFRQCFTIRGIATGKRGGRLVIDDPYDVKELMGSPDRVAGRMAEVVQIYNTTLESRLNDKRVDAVVLIMQRVHEADLAGVKIAAGWSSLVLPMEFEPKRADSKDWRTEPGELLEPIRFPREVVDATKAEMPAATYSALYQQFPTPAEGGLFKRENWVRLPRAQFPAKFERKWISGDLAFKGASSSDFCAFFVIGRVGSMRYILDARVARMHYGVQKATLRELVALHPDAIAKCIEDKANAHAMIDDLHREIDGLVLVPASVGKEERAQTWAPIQQARQIVLPEEAPWRDAFEAECEAFPRGLHDDQVDGLGHGILWDLAHPLQPTRVDLASPTLAQGSGWRV
jgi:predicted phage terminase large subunit-like protein